MKILNSYLDEIKIPEQKARMMEVFQWIGEEFPNLEATIKWDQPMFTDHGTFIIGFSMAKHHMSFTPEVAVITSFSGDIKKSGYDHTKGLVKIKWTDEVDYTLLRRIIQFNIDEKAECNTFFRK